MPKKVVSKWNIIKKIHDWTIIESENETELLDAMKQIANIGEGPGEQFSSAGCSIKWKTN